MSLHFNNNQLFGEKIWVGWTHDFCLSKSSFKEQELYKQLHQVFIFIGFIFLPCFILGRLLHFDFLSCVSLITLVENPCCPGVISPLDATTLQVGLKLQVLKIFFPSEALIPRPGLSLLSGFLQLYGWFSHSRTCCFVCSGTSTSFPFSTLTSHIETVREDVMTGPPSKRT